MYGVNYSGGGEDTCENFDCGKICIGALVLENFMVGDDTTTFSGDDVYFFLLCYCTFVTFSLS